MTDGKIRDRLAPSNALRRASVAGLRLDAMKQYILNNERVTIAQL